MHQYTFADMELLVELSRKWVLKTGKVPVGIISMYEEMVNQDVRLGMYYFNRALRYPKLKKALLEQRFIDVEDAYDEVPPLIEPGYPKIPEVMQPVTQITGYH